MNIEGTYTLLAPPGRVWHGMQNQQILLHTVPGIQQIEALDEHTFAITLIINQAPFIGNYQGKLTIAEQQFPYHYRIAIQGQNEQGQFHGDVNIHLQDRDNSTIVAYTGTVHLDSTQQSSSTTLARGAAKLLIQQFFTALDDQLRSNDVQDIDFATAIERYDVYSTAGTVGIKSKNGVILRRDVSDNREVGAPQSSSMVTHSEQRGLFYTLAHLLKLGNGEPEQEQIWAQRLRRVSTISSLLFLVWIGTRLPRPHSRS